MWLLFTWKGESHDRLDCHSFDAVIMSLLCFWSCCQFPSLSCLLSCSKWQENRAYSLKTAGLLPRRRTTEQVLEKTRVSVTHPSSACSHHLSGELRLYFCLFSRHTWLSFKSSLYLENRQKVQYLDLVVMLEWGMWSERSSDTIWLSIDIKTLDISYDKDNTRSRRGINRKDLWLSQHSSCWVVITDQEERVHFECFDSSLW